MEHNVTDVWRGPTEIIICSLVLFLIAITAFFGNVAVIYAVFKSSRLRDQVSNLFIVNLSVTDLLSSILVMFMSVVTIALDVREVPTGWCNMQCAANYILIIVSMMTLAFVSIDRYIAVMHPLHYCTRVTRRRVCIAIIWPWLQGISFALPPVLLQWVHYDYWEAVCAIDWSHEEAVIYVIVACILCFAVPGSIMVYCYVNIIREARKCTKHVQPMGNNVPISANLKTAIKTITSLLVVVVVFFVCMTPFCLTKLLKVVVADDYVPGYVNLASSYFEYLASVSNPFIYGIFRKEFRHAYRHICWHVSCKLSGVYPGSTDDSLTLNSIRQSFRRRSSRYTMNRQKHVNVIEVQDLSHKEENNGELKQSKISTITKIGMSQSKYVEDVSEQIDAHDNTLCTDSEHTHGCSNNTLPPVIVHSNQSEFSKSNGNYYSQTIITSSTKRVLSPCKSGKYNAQIMSV